MEQGSSIFQGENMNKVIDFLKVIGIMTLFMLSGFTAPYEAHGAQSTQLVIVTSK